ncbi:MAG TPA: tRNA pseudouridine(13) synthase TruD [Thermoplasmata archaeon]|nr:tRNA pseudouridine(13) synthase TruD [Thermoplasmata archaeon]
MNEADLGIGPHLTDTPGIGGRLRVEPSDFIVTEIQRHRGVEGGRYLVALIRAENWETNALVDAMARRLCIGRDRISFAGTKDKRAITERYFSFRDLDALDLRLKGVEVLEMSWRSTSVRMGDLRGNRFTIRVREVDPGALDRVEPIARVLLERGVPNYFGVQRFGAVRGNTHEIGRRIVVGDWQGAVDLIVGRPVEAEGEEIAAARRAYDEGEDPARVRAMFPPWSGVERTVLRALLSHPDRPSRAVAALPRNLQLMYVHAFQSYLFNIYLGERMERGLLDPQVGDLVAERDADGRPDLRRPHRVSTANLEKVRTRCASGRAAILGPIPGTGTEFSGDPSGDIMGAIMGREGVSTSDFAVRELPYLTTRGTYRPLLASLMEFSFDRRDVVFHFRLPPGTYATSVMREFMKVDDPMRY